MTAEQSNPNDGGETQRPPKLHELKCWPEFFEAGALVAAEIDRLARAAVGVDHG